MSVLMLGVLLISCATAFSFFARMQARSVSREADGLSLRTMASVIVNSVILMLSEATSRINYDSPVQRWYKPFAVDIPDLGTFIVQITPLDDKIPLRHLFLPDGNTMRREFSGIWREMWDKLKRRELETVALDFLDKNTRPRVGGKEEDFFLNRPPYDISELLILSGDIDADLLYGSGGVMGLSDYCTVYSDGKINLNVAPVHVMELLPGLDAGGLAQSIEEYRRENAIQSMRDLQNIPGASSRTSTQLTNIVSFKSRYFSVKIECIGGSEGKSSFTVIFDRTSKNIVRWEEI